MNQVTISDEGRYRALYPSPPSHPARGDGSVSSLYYHQHAIPEIRNFDPGMRIVIMLREPVSRAYSSFQYLAGPGFEDQEDFLTAVALEPRRTEQRWHYLRHYTKMSRYADSVAAFLEAFPREQVGIFFLDDLQDDFQGTLQGVMRFLGLDPAEVREAQEPMFADDLDQLRSLIDQHGVDLRPAWLEADA